MVGGGQSSQLVHCPGLCSENPLLISWRRSLAPSPATHELRVLLAVATKALPSSSPLQPTHMVAPEEHLLPTTKPRLIFSWGILRLHRQSRQTCMRSTMRGFAGGEQESLER